nr:hypothetical protein [Tanacetum cinerariifolium]
MGSDEIEPTDEESSDLEEANNDDEHEIVKIFRIETNLFNYETSMCENFKEFNYLLKIDPDTWTDNAGWKEPRPVKRYNKPFNYKTGCSEWPTCSWREDGYCNGGNFPGAYIVGNTLYYQDLEWYDALEDGEPKEEALRNKAIMEGIINEEDETSNDGWKR